MNFHKYIYIYIIVLLVEFSCKYNDLSKVFVSIMDLKLIYLFILFSWSGLMDIYCGPNRNLIR